MCISALSVAIPSWSMQLCSSFDCTLGSSQKGATAHWIISEVTKSYSNCSSHEVAQVIQGQGRQNNLQSGGGGQIVEVENSALISTDQNQHNIASRALARIGHARHFDG